MVHVIEEQKEPASPMQDINNVFEKCKFGRFHIRLLVTTFAGSLASVIVTISPSFLLPIAECDLNMDLRKKGIINAMPFIGMNISYIISGFLNDTFGRIIFLKIGYAGLFLFSLLSALSQNYLMFAVGKIGEGFFFATAGSAVVSMTSEFCHSSVRDRVVLCQASFSAMAQIICPAIAWVFLIQDWEWILFDGAFVLKTWNFFLLALSIWALVGCILYTTLPESPKFLVTKKKYIKAKHILINVYVANTGLSAASFPYPNLWEKEIKEEKEEVKNTEVSAINKFQAQVCVGLGNVKPLLKRPLFTYLLLIGFIKLAIVVTGVVFVSSAAVRNYPHFIVTIFIFCETVSLAFGVLKVWFPQLYTIVEHYEVNENKNLCGVLDSYMADERIRKSLLSNSTPNSTVLCVPIVSSSETYINSLIMGFVCILPYFLTGTIVNRLGKKYLILMTTATCIGALFGIRWANSKVMIVAMFSIDVAMTQMLKSLSNLVVVEVFPTNMRSLAMSIISSVGVFGLLVGNILFPILLDMGCETPFYTLVALLIGLFVMSIFIPKGGES